MPTFHSKILFICQLIKIFENICNYSLFFSYTSYSWKDEWITSVLWDVGEKKGKEESKAKSYSNDEAKWLISLSAKAWKCLTKIFQS